MPVLNHSTAYSDGDGRGGVYIMTFACSHLFHPACERVREDQRSWSGGFAPGELDEGGKCLYKEVSPPFIKHSSHHLQHHLHIFKQQSITNKPNQISKCLTPTSQLVRTPISSSPPHHNNHLPSPMHQSHPNVHSYFPSFVTIASPSLSLYLPATNNQPK